MNDLIKALMIVQGFDTKAVVKGEYGQIWLCSDRISEANESIHEQLSDLGFEKSPEGDDAWIGYFE